MSSVPHNDNNIKVLFDTPHLPNMIALSLTVKQLGAMLKVFGSTSKVAIKVR